MRNTDLLFKLNPQVDEESAPALMMAADLLLMERVLLPRTNLIIFIIFSSWQLASFWSSCFTKRCAR